MARVNIRLDHQGIGEILKSAEVRAALKLAASGVEIIAGNHEAIRRNGFPIGRESYTTDRAVESIAIEHPGGINVEAKHGVLVNAARVVGLEVVDRLEVHRKIVREIDRSNRKRRAYTRKAERMHRRFKKVGLA